MIVNTVNFKPMTTVRQQRHNHRLKMCSQLFRHPHRLLVHRLAHLQASEVAVLLPKISQTQLSF
jgi:hypothetical protein